MKFLVAFACIAVVSAELSNQYLPAATASNLKAFTRLNQPIARTSNFAPSYITPYSTYSSFYSYPSVAAPSSSYSPNTVRSSYYSAVSAPSFYNSIPQTSTILVSKAYTPLSYDTSAYSPTAARSASSFYNPALYRTNYQFPIASYYSQPLALPTPPQHSEYYPTYDTVYGGAPVLDTGSYSSSDGTVPIGSVVRADTDAVVTEAKFEVPEEAISIKPVALPPPIPTITTTETPFVKPPEVTESNTAAAAAASFNEIDGYEYKVPQNQLKFQIFRGFSN